MLRLKQKTKLTQLQEDRIIFEDIILRTMSSATKYVYSNAGHYEKWNEFKSGNYKDVNQLRKEFLIKLKIAISSYYNCFKKDHPKDNVEFNIVKEEKLIEDLENLKTIISTKYKEYIEDRQYYQKFIDLIKGKKVTNITDEEIYKYGMTTVPKNVDPNYMSNLGCEIMKLNNFAQKNQQKLIEEAEDNNGRKKEMTFDD